MNAKGIRRKKSSLSEVKVAVVGAPSVGKSGKPLSIFFCTLLLLLTFSVHLVLSALPNYVLKTHYSTLTSENL